MIELIQYIRSKECDIPFCTMDFQNDGEYVGGDFLMSREMKKIIEFFLLLFYYGIWLA